MVTFAAPEPAHHPDSYTTRPALSAPANSIFLSRAGPPSTPAAAARALRAATEEYTFVRRAKRLVRVRVRQQTQGERMADGRTKSTYRALLRGGAELVTRMRALTTLVRSVGRGERKRVRGE
ncbi:unnamed protein product [Cutaneotrichosporon oleaginosum]